MVVVHALRGRPGQQERVSVLKRQLSRGVPEPGFYVEARPFVPPVERPESRAPTSRAIANWDIRATRCPNVPLR